MGMAETKGPQITWELQKKKLSLKKKICLALWHTSIDTKQLGNRGRQVSQWVQDQSGLFSEFWNDKLYIYTARLSKQQTRVGGRRKALRWRDAQQVRRWVWIPSTHIKAKYGVAHLPPQQWGTGAGRQTPVSENPCLQNKVKPRRKTLDIDLWSPHILTGLQLHINIQTMNGREGGKEDRVEMSH